MRDIIINNENGHFDIIDFLKGFSILTIVIMHFSQGYVVPENTVLFRLLSIGGTGVHVFFFCSGFGLFYSWLNKKIDYCAFIRKRFYKVYIPYIIVVFLSFLLPYMYDGDARILALLSHVFLFKMFFSEYAYSFGAQLWYVSTIFQFYFVFIPLCHINLKLKNRFFPISLVISILWATLVALLGKQDIRTWNSFFLQFIWEFSLGMIFAKKLYDTNHFVIRLKLLCFLCIVCLAIDGFLGFKGGVFELYNDIPAAIGYGSLVFILYSLCGSNIKRLLYKMSSISYELFLVHMLVIETVFHIGGFTSIRHNAFLSALAFVISIAISFMYNHLLTKTIYKNRKNS